MTERGGRYFREARFFLGGDRAVAQSHIGEARMLLGYMRDQHALGGPSYQVQHTQLQDGTVIRGIMNNGLFQAEVISPLSGQESIDECPGFWSGLFAPWRSAEHTRVTATGDAEKYIGVEWYVPSAYQMTVTPDIFDTYIEDATKIALPMYFDNERSDPPELIYPLDSDTKTHGDVPETIARVFASHYTGEMRRFIQLLLGQGVDLTRTSDVSQPTVPVYPWGYAGTVGLVRVPGDAPQFWMVRFPSSDAYGVLATKIDVCVGGSNTDALEYIPIVGSGFPDDIGATLGKSVFEIMPRATFDTMIDGYYPLYGDCGWAFSDSGHEAQNVVVSTVELGALNFEVRAKRVKFSFAALADGITCSGEVVEEGTLHVPEPSSAPRFPNYATGVVESYAEMAFPTARTTTIGPLHVYYVGDAEHVWRIGTQYFDTETVDVSGNVPSSGTPCPGLYVTRTFASNRVDSWYELNGDRIGQEWSTGAVSTVNIEVYVSGAPPYAPPYILDGVDRLVYQLQQLTVWKKTWNEAEVTITARTTMFVPLHQRQGVQVFDFSVTQHPARNVSHQYLGVPTGPDMWRFYVDDDGVWHQNGHFSDFVATTGTCSLSQDIKTIFEGGTGASGYAGNVSILAGVTRPEPWYYDEAVPSEIIYVGKVVYHGAVSAVIEGSMTAGRIQNIYTPTSSENTQWTYGYDDAFDPSKYIVSRIKPSNSSEFVTSTDYDVASLSGFLFNFIGLANTGA